ncbi:hypothetical protein [Dyella sp. 20L07]|uniref:hypothetical protein n=1 Tax=Dyella sp. 20L07 TaxID=3384240 RepID=UPI003D27B7F8
MRQYKTWFALSFFWVPLIMALTLNPGRNGSYVPSFGSPKLVLLGICGLLMVVYFLANVGTGRLQAACCKRDEASWSTVGQAWFSLALGLLALWWSATSLLNH